MTTINPTQQAAAPVAAQQDAQQAVLENHALEESGGSYYLTATLQKSAGAGPFRAKVDRQLAVVILRSAKSGGRIGVQEAHEILVKDTDGGRYGEGEKELTRLLLAACDDRKHATLNVVRLRVTDPAEKVLQRELPKWWGSLAG
jgi:hypothetical protein